MLLRTTPASTVTITAGGVDDTNAINAAFAPGIEVLLDSGIYYVQPDGLTPHNRGWFRVGANAELRTLANSTSGGATIKLRNRYYVTVTIEGKVTGDRDVVGSTGVNHVIAVLGGRHNKIIGPTGGYALEAGQGALTGGSADGLYIGKGSVRAVDTTVSDMAGVDNARNGISIVSAITGTLTDCAGLDSNGSAPEAGVDLEPNAGETVTNWTFTRCQFSGNAGTGISVDGTAGTLANVQFIDCDVSGNASQYAVNIDNASQVTLQGGSVTGGSGMQVHVVRSDNITIDGVNVPGGGGSNGIYFDFDVDTALVEGCQVGNVTVVAIQINHVDALPECTNITVRNTAVDGAFYGVWFKANSSGTLGPGMNYANCSDSDTVIDPAADVILA